jgi:hypothetical protein
MKTFAKYPGGLLINTGSALTSKFPFGKGSAGLCAEKSYATQRCWSFDMKYAAIIVLAIISALFAAAGMNEPAKWFGVSAVFILFCGEDKK